MYNLHLYRILDTRISKQFKTLFVINYTTKICLRLKKKKTDTDNTLFCSAFSSLQSTFSYFILLNFHNFEVEHLRNEASVTQQVSEKKNTVLRCLKKRKHSVAAFIKA